MDHIEGVADLQAHELSRAESLSLLTTAPFGRLVFTEGALPAVLAVSFVVDGDRIVLRTRTGGSISQAVPGQVVAFQADDLDPARRAGWSVTVVGRASRIEDRTELDRLARLPLAPWLSGERRTVIAVDIGLVSGRRLGGAEPAHSRPGGERADAPDDALLPGDA